MPQEMIGEVVGEIVQGGGEIVVEEVHKRWGWKGCALTLFLIGGVIAGAVYLLSR